MEGTYPYSADGCRLIDSDRSLAGAASAGAGGLCDLDGRVQIDNAGVTAAFNRNMLDVLNRELDGDLPVDGFAHRAVWNADEERIEMHLVADPPVHARLDALPLDVTFQAGEPLVTEYSCKFHIDHLTCELRTAGLDVQEVWTDPNDGFAVLLATA